MTHESPKYWFPAKRYGWGWGPPSSWQGWVVFAVWLAAIIAVAILFAGRNWPLYGASVALLVIGLVVVCWLKGEPPAWRWG